MYQVSINYYIIIYIYTYTFYIEVIWGFSGNLTVSLDSPLDQLRWNAKREVENPHGW